MARSAPAPPVAQSNIRWYEATFDAEGKSVRVQYLSDRELNNGQIANLVARGEDYGRVWVDNRAQGTARRISEAAEAIRNAGEPTETRVAARASAGDIQHFNSLRTLEAARPALERAAEEFAGAGGRIASAFGVPVRTERARSEDLELAASIQRGGRSRPGELVTGTSLGERGRVVPAAEETSISREAERAQAEATAQPEERRGQRTYRTTPYSVMRGASSVMYEFEVVYDSSRTGVGIPPVSQYGYVDAPFFDKPENRAGVVRYRYRRAGVEGAEWGAWQAPGSRGQEFHRDFMKLTKTPISYEVRDAEGVVARFNLYLDQEAAQRAYGTSTEMETRRRIMEGLSNAEDPLKFLRDLQEKGLIAGFSTQSGSGGEVIWVRGNVNNFIASLERTYGRDAGRLGFTQA